MFYFFRHSIKLSILLIAGCRENNITLTSTNLPLVLIETNGRKIVDEQKITADMKIIANVRSSLNTPNDIGNIYSGKIGIEIRGHASMSFPQKQYGFETRDNRGKSINVPLMNMSSENDWILLSTYNDKVFMKNTLAFHLYEKMGHYAPHSNLCEVIINNKYKGIYLLTEKIKRDKNRVNISKMDQNDNNGDNLTGGYIFSVDYYEESDNWESSFKVIGRPDESVHFVYVYPDSNVITIQQKAYIKSFVDRFENILYRDNFKDSCKGYRAYINVESFIDFFIISEVSRNVDAYRKSCYFYKDRDSQGGLLNVGPVWDFEYAWQNHENGNCYIYTSTNGSGWTYRINDCTLTPLAPSWMTRLLEDTAFQKKLYTRYTAMRKTILSKEYLNNYIDSVHTLVSEALLRHYKKWPILGKNEGALENEYIPITFNEEVEKFKNWIWLRLSWLDANMPGKEFSTLTTNVHIK